MCACETKRQVQRNMKCAHVNNKRRPVICTRIRPFIREGFEPQCSTREYEPRTETGNPIMIKTRSCLWFRGSVPAFSVWPFEMSEMRKVLGIVFFCYSPFVFQHIHKNRENTAAEIAKIHCFCECVGKQGVNNQKNTIFREIRRVGGIVAAWRATIQKSYTQIKRRDVRRWN